MRYSCLLVAQAQTKGAVRENYFGMAAGAPGTELLAASLQRIGSEGEVRLILVCNILNTIHIS